MEHELTASLETLVIRSLCDRDDVLRSLDAARPARSAITELIALAVAGRDRAVDLDHEALSLGLAGRVLRDVYCGG